MTFASPVRRVCFAIARNTFAATTVTVTVRGTDNQVLTQQTVPLTPKILFAEGTFSFCSSAGISSVSIDFPQGSGGNRFIIDNLAYSATASNAVSASVSATSTTASTSTSVPTSAVGKRSIAGRIAHREAVVTPPSSVIADHGPGWEVPAASKA